MPSPDYKRGQRVIAGKTGATGATGPMSDRAALVEEIAVEGLKIAERLDDEVLALSAQSSMTAAEVAEIRRDLAEQWVDTLPNDGVWLTPEAGQAIRDSGVGQRVYDYWTSPGRGIASWAFDR